MKHSLLLLLVLFSLTFCHAQQKLNPIKLKKGQNIHLVNNVSMEMDMGMGMLMKNVMEINNFISVTGENDKDYTLSNKVTRIKGSMEMMGNKKEFDSDNPSDDEMTKSFTEQVGKQINVTLNKETGNLVFDKTDDNDANPLKDMIKGFGNTGEDPSVGGAFFQLPAGKKAGDTWVEKDSSAEEKIIKTFVVNSINGTIATIGYKSESIINNNTEVQGTQINVSMNTKTSGEIVSDVTTSIVSKKTSDAEINGTVEAMGQSTIITGKTNMITTYTVK